MATLTGQRIKDSYKDLLQVSNSNSGIDSTLRVISDGEATDSVLQLSTTAVNISSAGALQYAGVAITSTAAELNILDGATVTVAELNVLDGYTGSVTELNYLDTLHATGVTATEFDYLDGVTSSIQVQLDATFDTVGTGLDTSGTTISLDLNELGTETSIADADFLVMVDATDDGSQKITFENLEDAIFSSVSGDITITEAGVAAIQANSVALATDTTGNYVATVADSGDGGITVANSGSENAGVTLELDVHGLTTAILTSGDFIAFSDEDQSGDPSRKESIDDIATLFAGAGMTASSAVINVIAGTGIDVAADAISVDVSDFMANGSNNRILTATGTDAFRGEGNLTFDGSTLAVTGAITGSSTLNVTGVTTLQNHLELGDSDKIKLGASADLEIYHDGTNSVINNTQTGALQIYNNVDDGMIELLTDNGSGGTQVFLRADGANNMVRMPVDGVKFTLGDASDLQLYHDGSNNYLRNNTTDQDFKILVNDGGSTITALWIDSSDVGSVKLPQDNQKLSIGSGNDLSLRHDGSHSYIENITGGLLIRNQSHGSKLQFGTEDSSGTLAYVLNITGDNHRVGIGTTTPGAKLDVVGGDIHIDATQKIYLDGGSDTYIYEQAADTLDFVVGGQQMLTMVEGGTDYVRVGDNIYLGAGSSLDMYMQHDGTNSYLRTDTGDLYLQNANSDGDVFIRVNDGGSTINAIQIDTSEVGRVKLPNDNQYLSIGASGDLYFYHDSSNSIIRNATGDLYLRNDEADKDIIFQTDDGSGGVTAYLTLDGSQTRTNVSKDLRLDNSVNLQLGGGGNMSMSHDGSNATFSNATGNLTIQTSTDDGTIIFNCDDGSGGLANYYIIDGANSINKFYKHIRLPVDSQEISVGAGNDFRMTHDGSDTYINNDVGTLSIIQNTDNGNMVFKNDNGSGGTASYFYLDGTNERTQFDKGAKFVDNAKIQVGTGVDLEIYHNGTNSFINNNTGYLQISQKVSDGDMYFEVNDGGSAINALQIDGSAAGSFLMRNDNQTIELGAGGDLRFKHDGTNSSIENLTGSLYIDNNEADTDIIFRNDDGSGGVTAYLTLDGSATTINVAKNLDIGDGADNVRVRLGAGQDLQLGHDGTNSFISNSTGNLDIKNFGDDKDIILYNDDGGGGVTPYLTLDGSVTKTIFNQDAALSATKKLFLDGGGHSYIVESAADVVDLYAGAELMMRWDETNNAVSILRDADTATFNIGVGSDLELYVESGGADTAIIRSRTGDFKIMAQAADADMRFFCDDGSGGDDEYLRLDGGATSLDMFVDTRLAATKKLYLDGGANTYITETSADLVDLYVGGQNALRVLETSNVSYAYVPDNMYLGAGTGIDFTIRHDTSHTYITNSTGDMNFVEADAGNINFRNNSGTSHLYIKTGGNIGIGTTSPGEKLHIVSGSGDARILLDAPNGSDTEIKFFNAGSAVYTIGHDDGTGFFVLGGANVDAPLLSVDNTGVVYIKHGGSDYTPGIVFLGGSNTAGSNAHENAHIAYYDNSGTGTMLFEGKRGAMNWAFNDSDETLFLMTSDGDFHAEGTVTADSSSVNSDRRLKENINPIPYGLEEVLKMNPVEYDWKEKRNKAHDIGVIAQEIEEIIPEVVRDNKDLNSDKIIKSVDYSKMVAVLIKAVQEQQVQIDELKTKLGE